MQTQLEHLKWSIPLVVLLGSFVAVGACSGDTSGQGGNGSKCDSDETYDSEQGECVEDDSDDGNNGDGPDGGMTADAGDTGPYPNGVCKKREKYLQVFQPNIYIVLDTSSSMAEGNKMKQAKNGLKTMADQIADEVRIGIYPFPPRNGSCHVTNVLKIGSHKAKKIKKRIDMRIQPGGGTPTGAALSEMQQSARLGLEDDPKSNKRNKAIVLITDGQPNDKEVCKKPKNAVKQAKALAKKGIAAHVVGFQSKADPKTLTKLANAGGTSGPKNKKRAFYKPKNGSQLAKTIQNVTGSQVACSFRLKPPPPDGSTVNVTLGNQKVPSKGYSFDGNKVRVKGKYCEQLREKAPSGTSLNIDVGCPDCALEGESCESTAECCDGKCKNGTCQEQCHAVGEDCLADSECCSGNCGNSSGDDPIGSCVSG